MKPPEAVASLKKFAEFALFHPDTPAVHEHWSKLVATYDVSGKAAHDANHVAAMLAHGIADILTFDRSDFRRFEQLVRVRTPAEILGESQS